MKIPSSTKTAMLLVILCFSIVGSNPAQGAYAAEVKSDIPQFSIAARNINLPTAIHDEILYLLRPGGIYKYSDNSCHKIYDGRPNFADVSEDGRQMVFSENGSLKLLNLVTRKVNTLLTGDEHSFVYEQPAWLPDMKGLLYSMRVIKQKASQQVGELPEPYIYSIDLSTGKQTKLAEGTCPSYLRDKDVIVFERNSKIIYKSLIRGFEKVIDDGNSPKCSPDGRYIAYTKVTTKIRKIKANIRVEENLQDVWIVDTRKFDTKRKVTSNFLIKNVDEQGWLKNLKPSTGLQNLSYACKYCYLFPTWTSDSKNLFVVTRIYPDINPEERIESVLGIIKDVFDY